MYTRDDIKNLDITYNMYSDAKMIVHEYEKRTDPKKILKSKMDDIFDKDNYNNPNEVGEIMPCCGRRYVFSYARMKYLPKNPNLKYRKKDAEGDVDYDEESKDPFFVEYNNAREAIRQAKRKGYNHVHWRMSVACSERIRKDGYLDHNDELDTISWKDNSIGGLFSLFGK